LCASRTASTSCTWDKFVHLEPNPDVKETDHDYQYCVAPQTRRHGANTTAQHQIGQVYSPSHKPVAEDK
jgi:hypothetical protein